MRISNIELYREDIEHILKKNDLNFLSGKKILITGGTGLICSSIVDILLQANEEYGLNTYVYLACRNLEKAMERFGENPFLFYLQYDALKKPIINVDIDYIIHGAGNASPELYVSQAVETMLINFNGLNQLLKYAHEKNVEKCLFISSSEVYGTSVKEGTISEDSYGYVDLLNTRSSYAMSKRAAETLCKAYLDEYGVNTVIVRPGHIFGPTASEKDKRVATMFMFQAARGEKLIMKSSGNQQRSYVYCLDCAYLILKILDNGLAGEAYNICGDKSIKLREMAECLAKEGNVDIVFENANEEEILSFNPMNNSSLCNEKIKKLGLELLFPPEQYLKRSVMITRELLKGRENG